MKNKNIILYAGKTLGNLVLNYMIKNHSPEYLIPNLDDNGKDNLLHESTIKIAKNNGVKITNNKKLINLCKKKTIDYIICAGTTIIIPQKILNSCKNGAINFHPSLLPKHRGRYSTVHAIFNGEKNTGVTCHWISSEIDKGNIIYQKNLKLEIFTLPRIYMKFLLTKHLYYLKECFQKFYKIKKLNLKKLRQKQNIKKNTFQIKVKLIGVGMERKYLIL